MADEPTAQTTNPTEPVVEPTEPTAVTAPSEPVPQEPTRPHPLESGGERFNEVYGRMKAAEARAEALQAQIAQAQTQTAAQAPRVYSAQDVQAFIDAGRITPAQGADYLAEQRVNQASKDIERRLEQKQVLQSVQSEVNSYLTSIPALHNASSEEFSKVSTVAWEIATELGLDVKDVRVQKQALRQVFGTLEKVKATRQASQVSRTSADTHTESGGGGGGSLTPQASNVLKGIPAWQISQWQRWGYTQKQMEDEAKYFSPKKRMIGVS